MSCGKMVARVNPCPRHYLGRLVSFSAAFARVCLLFFLLTTLSLQSYKRRFPRLRQSLSLCVLDKAGKVEPTGAALGLLAGAQAEAHGRRAAQHSARGNG
jgi:hypothetical protein